MSLLFMVQWVGAFGIAALMVAVWILFSGFFTFPEEQPILPRLLLRFVGFFLLLCAISFLMFYWTGTGLPIPLFAAVMFVVFFAAATAFGPSLELSVKDHLPRLGFIALFVCSGVFLLASLPW